MHPIPIADWPFELRRGAELPLYEQLRAGLARCIRDGRLAAGSRLPATRSVASQLGLNRTTVVEAYRRLQSEGLVEKRVGSGTYVREPGASVRTQVPAPPAVRGVPAADGGQLDLASIVPDERRLPTAAFGTSLQAVLAARGGGALGYGPPAGDRRLREVLAARLRDRGLEVDASALLIVGGAQQGLDLLLRAVAPRGSLVLTELPTYHHALDLLRFHGLETASYPIVPRAGGLATVDLDRLRALLERRPLAVYSMPTLHNPTGLTLDLEARRLVASACRRAGTVLIEDDYEADLRRDAEPLPPMASLPEAGDVAYVGTLSKTLCPGLRVGWVAAPPRVLESLVAVKRITDLSGSVLLQAAAADLIESGEYDRHVARLAGENRRRLGRLADALESALPDVCGVTRPQGGHALWVTLPAGVSARGVATEASQLGLAVSPGDLFQAHPQEWEGLRLSVSRIDDTHVPLAAERLARALAAVMGSPSRARADPGGRESPLRI